MLRTFIAAIAIGASMFGAIAELTPTASYATANATTATAIVTWEDSASDFTFASDDFSPEGDRWYWSPLAESSPGEKITDHATFAKNGLSVATGDGVALYHGLSRAISPKGVIPLVASASAEATGATSFALVIRTRGDASSLRYVFAVSDGDAGLSGSATEWFDPFTNTIKSTSELADGLAEADEEVVSYFVFVGAAVADGSTATGAGLISALRIDDTTTYFTPQPTAAARLLTTSATLTEATTTGVRVQGSGFAPNEVVTAAVGDTADAVAIPGVEFRADADGNVSGTIVLPADLVDSAGTYVLGLLGLSSGQTAATTLTVTADAVTAPVTLPVPGPVTAPVAVPVPGTASFTG